MDSSNAQLIRTLKDVKNVITSLVVLNNGKLFSNSSDSIIKIWDINSGYILKTFTPSHNMIHSLVALEQHNNNYIACGLNNGQIEIWNIKKW